jgi:hypothetical protein
LMAMYPNAWIPQRILRFRIGLARSVGVPLSIVLAVTVTGCPSRQARLATAHRLDFNQDVQPILASNCFSCHGPDPEMRKAGLRLDVAESAFAKRPGHPDAIVPGHPERSELIKRIYNCLMARRMAERGVRFTQIYKRGWDVHGDVTGVLPQLCQETDRACYALITDLKQRGLLDDTLVVWAGEFGRTVYSQGGLTADIYGRDHHPRCFTTWMAGGGVRPGITYGETDEYSYNIIKDPVPVRDFNATILHCLRIDHNKLTFKFQGLAQKLTGSAPASVVQGILA